MNRQKRAAPWAAVLSAGTSFLGAPASAAQDAAPAPPEAASASGSESSTGTVYEPAFFAQFAPRNALDMVSRIPGFSISGGDSNGQRGLGQASQNVLVNGTRFSSKSESVRDQLSRIPAGDVIRIELVDGNTLDIPGLTGLVANVIYRADGLSGQFRWDGGFRPHNTDPQLYGGEVSVSGRRGALGFTAALTNDNDRFGADGTVLILASDGSILETQDTRFAGGFDNPQLTTTISYDFGGAVLANLNLSYGEDYYYREEPEIGRPAIGPVRQRSSRTREDGPEYEFGGDLTLPLSGGTLKLIALERFERENYSSVVIDRFAGGLPATGFRFAQVNEIGERIGRVEYGWTMWDGEWQIAGEAAANRLDRVSALAVLDDSAVFVPVDFPAGTGGVRERRYEASLSYSRRLSPALSVQAIGIGEFSRIEQTGAAANSRSFARSKGSLAVTWKPNPALDVSLTLARRVSQLSFGDFLASISLDDDNQNDGNNALVPYQSWNIEAEANRSFGAWGSLKLELRQAWFEDFTDWFPLEGTGEARGNIGAARRLHLGLTSTINFDPVGWRGARLDIQAVQRWMNVTDPFTGLDRPFSSDQRSLLNIEFRHDIPASAWAWGGNLFTENLAPYSRRYEVGREWEGPLFAGLFVENKDVAGLTVTARARNILGARDRFERTVYDSPRPAAPIAFVERRDRPIGPTFSLSVSGNF